MRADDANPAEWPPLPLAEWSDTLETLRHWAQLVGKVALALAPPVNHWWGTTLLVTPRGLGTQVFYHGTQAVRLELDFVDHVLTIEAGASRTRLALAARSVADFHEELLASLTRSECPVVIGDAPTEMEAAVPFAEDDAPRRYDDRAVEAFHAALLAAHRAIEPTRASFLGKQSPVHFFWGGFDLAYTRFSGRAAPQHPGGVPNMPDWVTREAYSHEVWSAGWWPGHGPFGRPAFYAYAYPEPAGFAEADAGTAGAFYSTELREFLLPWDDARSARNPDDAVRSFLRATYEAAATRGGWDRATLERAPADLALLERRIRKTNRPR